MPYQALSRIVRRPRLLIEAGVTVVDSSNRQNLVVGGLRGAPRRQCLIAQAAAALNIGIIPERTFADQHAVHDHTGLTLELYFERVALGDDPPLTQQMIDVRA